MMCLMLGFDNSNVKSNRCAVNKLFIECVTREGECLD